MKRLGIDIGSLYLSAVVLGKSGIVSRHYEEHRGNVGSALRALLARAEFSSWDTAGITGSGASMDGRLRVIDSTLATIEGARRLLPAARTIIAIGGQSFLLIVLDENGVYREHSTNPPCASGTGSFLEQQAERLGLGAREFSERAAGYSGAVPRIATRCAVFAKTDTIHAIQEGHSLEAVCAGLCEGIARSVLDSLRKGRDLLPPVGLVGGVSLNGKIASSLRAQLGIEVVVPPDSNLAGALGAACLGGESSLDIDSLVGRAKEKRQVRPPLPRTLGDYPDFSRFDFENHDGVEILRPRESGADGGDGEQVAQKAWTSGAYLGLDIGSTSTKAVLVDRDAAVLGGFYTRTAGEPIAAVQRLLASMERSFSGAPRILGACTTGSGRRMIREVFNADREVNEITAHARAAVFLEPRVDTIVEIGGQDSKFTRITDGEVSFSAMNYVCAAGTGSFIEEQAKRLGVTLAEFSDMALSDRAPFTSDRCTVYMERDIGGMLAEGWPREALAAAVLHSVRDNYLSKVVGRTSLGDCVVFQGATARNPALVAAFEQLLGKTMHVSPLCHLTGALGAALGCREEGLAESSFSWDRRPVVLSVEECPLCANKCELTVAERAGVRTGWGMKCGREYSARKAPDRVKGLSAMETRFRCGFEALRSEPPSRAAASRSSIIIGIPGSLYSLESEPLWSCFLHKLGFTVRVSSPRQEALDQGIAAVNSDFCAPMILAHGYTKQLIEGGVDFVFAPALVNEREGGEPIMTEFRKRVTDSAYCYYSQYLPSVLAKLTAFKAEDRLLSPLLPLREKSDDEIARIIHAELSPRFPDMTGEETVQAYREARHEFQEAWTAWASGFKDASARARTDERLRIVLLGRPYAVFDPVLNLSIPKLIEEQGADIFWQEELDLDHEQPGAAGQYLERMHWHYGKRILLAAQVAARTKNLYPVFLTSFRCSPDSFLITYLRDLCAASGKPFLILQLDAHASEVGYVTRIESAVQAFRAHRRKEASRSEPARSEPAVTKPRNDPLSRGDTVLILAVDELFSRFWTDTLVRAGYDAVLLKPSASALSTGYRYASGGECMPLVSIVGAALELAQSGKIDPARSFFFMPTIPMACNMPQFPIFAGHAFRSAGLPEMKVGLLNFLALGDDLPQTVSTGILEDYILGCTLHKMLHRVRPYETEKGATDRALSASADLISRAIRDGEDARSALAQAVDLFKAVPRDESTGRKPRIALLGDLYVKYSDVVSEKLQSLIESLGGELVISSMSEYPAHFLDLAARRYGESPRSYRLLRAIDQRFEKLADELIADQREPDIAECVELMERYGLRHTLAGETSINVGRALWYCEHRSVEAIVHVNPMFCCPGVVSASLFRKIQEDFGIPIIDIFYDGTGNPNSVLIPHLHYLGRKERAAR